MPTLKGTRTKSVEPTPAEAMFEMLRARLGRHGPRGPSQPGKLPRE